jgi:hypothetical protein
MDARPARSAAPTAAIPLFLAALAISLTTAASGQAQGDASRLVFEPAAPTPGAVVAVRYRPVEPPGAKRMVLRARLRTPRHDSYNDGFRHTQVAELRLESAGAYVGEFMVPDDVVFGAFAVETPAADRADDNGGRPWELLVHDGEGRPLYEALEQRFHDHMGRDMREVMASVRRATELYPDRPGGWTMLNAAESWSAGAADQAEARERRRARSLEVAARIAERGDLSAHEVAEMSWLLSGTPEAQAWRDRLERDHPDHALLVMNRIYEVRSAHREDPDILLDAYDELWATLTAGGEAANVREEGIRVELASLALRLAAAEDRPDLIDRWAARFRETASPDRQVNTLLGIPRLRDDGLHVARGEIERLRALRAEDRPLGQTVDEQRAAQLVAIGRIQGRMGQALVEAGRVEDGAAALREAVARMPSTTFLRELGDAELDLGDPTAALVAWARASAHPTTPSAFADTVRDRLGAAFDPVAWEEARSAAHAGFIEVTRARAVQRPLPALELATRTGERRSFRELVDAADAAVVVFVSRHCGPSTQAMPRIQELAGELAGRGVVVLPVTQDPTGEEYPETYREAGVDIAVWHDVTGDAAHAFNVWGTPQYYIVDRGGVIRYERTGLPSIPLELEALIGPPADHRK